MKQYELPVIQVILLLSSHTSLTTKTESEENPPPTMILKTCVVAFIGTAIAVALTAVEAVFCFSTSACGSNTFSSNIRISQCCENYSGDFTKCCATSCSSGSPCR
ncbi:hypothetical protein F444_10282 [Phytophthora nicotianae P1976]|uniref:Phytotoxin PcF domain-containing protein n=1 Tax=Phytophthora nicotianae P1976 TaxID=1317066 RepID=A0A081A4J0_PHYNI|nr:hypothetical protein F444_10282 [Phytophthora nicotianae P1976]